MHFRSRERKYRGAKSPDTSLITRSLKQHAVDYTTIPCEQMLELLNIQKLETSRLQQRIYGTNISLRLGDTFSVFIIIIIIIFYLPKTEQS